MYQSFTLFTGHSKPDTGIGWWLVHWNIEKYNTNLRIYRL